MVQVITTERKRGLMNYAVTGLTQGLSKGAEMGLSMKLQQMMNEKAETKQDAAYMNYASQLAKAQGGGDKDLEAAYASLNYSALKTGGLDALKSMDISPLQMQDLIKDAREHQASQYQQPEYRQQQAQQQTQIPIQQQLPPNQYLPLQKVPIQPREAMSYEDQMGNAGPQTPQRISPIHAAPSKNVNPILLPESKYQQTQPGAGNGPNLPSQQQTQAAFPQTQPQAPRQAEEDRFMTNHPGIVKDLSLAQTPDEALKYVNNALPLSKRKEAYSQWLAAKKLEAEQQKSQVEIRREEREQRKEIRELEKEPKEYIKNLDEEYNSTLRKRPIYKAISSKAIELQPKSVLQKYITDKFDLPAGMILNEPQQAIDKLSLQLLRGIGNDFKGRILQSEVETFLKSSPSLLNTPEGMQKLAKISMALDDVAEERWKAKNEIVKEYRSRKEPLPEDIEAQVLERSAGFAEKAYDKVTDIMSQKGLQGTLNLKEGQKLDKMPSAAEAGERSLIMYNGKKYISDGKTWREYK
jgi:hypothetical protein